jgi:ribonuclease P protein component
MIAAANRLRRHGDYQRVYRSSRKHFGKQMSYFFLLREPQSTTEDRTPPLSSRGPRIGLTVSRAMGKAVVRNRIKRRMREAVRRQMANFHAPVDVVLHPNRRVMEIDFPLIEQDVAQIFQTIQRLVDRRERQDAPNRAGERR